MQLGIICLILGIVIYLHKLQFAFGGIICPWSRYTSEKVASCPENQNEVEVRAKKKNCESINHKQNCTSPENIKYHCVINELENAFIEVCAPEYRIHGYCTEYNEVGAVIQAHHNLKCENVKPPCFSSYISTEAYHCKILSISFLSLSFTSTITGYKCMFSKVFLYHFFLILCCSKIVNTSLLLSKSNP